MAYTVDSSVMRRISHFRRSSVNVSGMDVGGGRRMANAASNRVYVSRISL